MSKLANFLEASMIVFIIACAGFSLISIAEKTPAAKKGIESLVR